MSVVVGYVPTAEGKAALRKGIEEARLRSAAIEAHDGQLVVIGLRRRSAVGKILLGSAALSFSRG